MYNDSNARKEIMNDNKVNNSLKTKNEKTSFDIIKHIKHFGNKIVEGLTGSHKACLDSQNRNLSTNAELCEHSIEAAMKIAMSEESSEETRAKALEIIREVIEMNTNATKETNKEETQVTESFFDKLKAIGIVIVSLIAGYEIHKHTDFTDFFPSWKNDDNIFLNKHNKNDHNRNHKNWK